MLAKLVLCALLCVACSQVSLASQELLDVFQAENSVKPQSDACNSYIAQLKKGLRNIIMLVVEGLGLPVVFGGLNLVCIVTTWEVKKCTGHFFVAMWHLARYLVKWTAIIVGTIAYSVYGAASDCFTDYLVHFSPVLLP